MLNGCPTDYIIFEYPCFRISISTNKHSITQYFRVQITPQTTWPAYPNNCMTLITNSWHESLTPWHDQYFLLNYKQ